MQRKSVDFGLIPSAEAAAALRKSESTLRRWRKIGKGPPYVQLEGQIFYTQDSLELYLHQRTLIPEACEAA